MIGDDTTEPAVLSVPGLVGDVAVVTGAASGIGRASALALARCGVQLVLVDREESGARSTADDCVSGGAGAVEVVVVDLADMRQVRDVVPAAVRRFGRVDILVNAAGVTSPTGLLDLTEEEWDVVLDVDLKAPFVLVQEFARHAVARGGGGKIVNISSSSAYRARLSNAAYGSAKAGIVALTRSAAAELGAHDINVNAVVPGLTRSPTVRAHFSTDDALERAVESGPLENLLGRLSEPEDVANTVLFLCSAASRQITGQAVHTSAGAVV